MVGRVMSMKNSSDTFGNRTCDFPACSAVQWQINVCRNYWRFTVHCENRYLVGLINFALKTKPISESMLEGKIEKCQFRYASVYF